MKQKDRIQKKMGSEGFESYYSSIYKERWPILKAALLDSVNQSEFNAGGNESYFLDRASVRAVCSLPLDNAKSILDMCAAPGGKSLILATSMEKGATLLCNERSAERRLRLVHNIQNCLPEEVQNRITVIGKDGGLLCLSKENRFDRILLDAPCSSERHVLQDENYLKDWSPSRVKKLSFAQWTLLSSAWRMLNQNGYLLYSTCAMNQDENDCVIERLLKKFDDVQIFSPEIAIDVSSFCSKDLPQGEKTEFGVQILPDICENSGPIYFSLLHKKNI
ncbi:RsmB/NOP family class I SAM-dependent RNA methyltransferase [Treponema pectinovorum]|uniref:RsmB/NOP family class I SAM-dependent RNA methyltransferase n=1 Tax=Treponema pectinovorum TaxID=164 RepID=UPI0011F1EA90|nr:RsmB/NOP family class I SAM-dependent RNA methyltransferase [Treponema pectinovorum]